MEAPARRQSPKAMTPMGRRTPAAVLAVAALLFAGCSDDTPTGAPEPPADEETTTEARSTDPPSTERATTTTTEPVPQPPPQPVPEVGTSALAACEYLELIDDAQDEAEVEWVTIPTPPQESAPLLVLGFSLDGARETDAEIASDQVTFVGAALPYLARIVEARPDLSSVVVVSSGNNFDLAHKTLWQFTPDELAGLEDGDQLARTAETAEWTQGRLPFTYLGPDPSRLDDIGSFVDGSACTGLT
jgi:hypothetical protein